MKVEWESGGVSFEPLGTIAADDPATRAICAKEQELLETAGWKRFRSLARRAKKMPREVNQSKMQSCKTCEKRLHGVKIPRNYEDGVRLDKLGRVVIIIVVVVIAVVRLDCCVLCCDFLKLERLRATFVNNQEINVERFAACIG